mmetsp:Transcript_12018/g.48404  ORF Transcript_12018/g.48404 Transcript_12018/m.48404 type:complete len:270 (-) Transcript_12018:677-1486(-)
MFLARRPFSCFTIFSQLSTSFRPVKRMRGVPAGTSASFETAEELRLGFLGVAVTFLGVCFLEAVSFCGAFLGVTFFGVAFFGAELSSWLAVSGERRDDALRESVLRIGVLHFFSTASFSRVSFFAARWPRFGRAAGAEGSSEPLLAARLLDLRAGSSCSLSVEVRFLPADVDDPRLELLLLMDGASSSLSSAAESSWLWLWLWPRRLLLTWAGAVAVIRFLFGGAAFPRAFLFLPLSGSSASSTSSSSSSPSDSSSSSFSSVSASLSDF